MLTVILSAYFQSWFTHCQLWQLARKAASRQVGKFKPTRQIQCHCHRAVPGLPGGTAPQLGLPSSRHHSLSMLRAPGIWTGRGRACQNNHSSAPHTCPQSPAAASIKGQGSETPPLQASALRWSTNWPRGRSPFHHLGGYGLWHSNSAALCPINKDQFQCALLGCQWRGLCSQDTHLSQRAKGIYPSSGSQGSKVFTCTLGAGQETPPQGQGAVAEADELRCLGAVWGEQATQAHCKIPWLQSTDEYGENKPRPTSHIAENQSSRANRHVTEQWAMISTLLTEVSGPWSQLSSPRSQEPESSGTQSEGAEIKHLSGQNCFQQKHHSETKAEVKTFSSRD